MFLLLLLLLLKASTAEVKFQVFNRYSPPVVKMGDEIECPWEDKFSRRFDQLSVRDDETGECWDSAASSSLIPSSTSASCSSGASAVPNCNNNVLLPPRMRLFSSLTPFKIPKEYSGLGCNSQLVFKL